jgi:leucyl aminopeptidase
MYLTTLLAVFAASSCALVSAKVPISIYTSRATPPGPGLRLIKTSEQDPGRWMTDDEKLDYVGKHIHFIDITDIEVSDSREKS